MIGYTSGFPLRTSGRQIHCEKCKYYFRRKKHRCIPDSSPFERVSASTEEFTYIQALFKAADYAAWVNTMTLQVAKVKDTNVYYLLTSSFYNTPAAALIDFHGHKDKNGLANYTRIKPRSAVGWVHPTLIFYVNEDYSAAMIPVSIFGEES